MKTLIVIGLVLGIGIILIASVYSASETRKQECISDGGIVTGPFSCVISRADYADPLTRYDGNLDYSQLLMGADKNIDIAHHLDIIPINSTKHAFSIKSINLNSEDSITINFGGVNENFLTIPEFNYTRTFQVNDSFVFYCMPTESGYPSMGVYKYLGTQIIDGNQSYAFYHGDAMSQNKFECIYPEIIEKSVNIFDIELTPEMLQRYEIKLD